MADDEILVKFSADIASYEKAIDNIEAKTLGVQKAADETAKRFSNIGKNANFAPINKGLKDTTQELTKANREAKKTGEELSKTSKQSINGFTQLRNELKAVRGQMASLSVAGKENTEEFKKLQIQAGALQDQMKDLGASISQNAGDPLENLSGGIGALKGSISSLDFDGVSRSLASLATNVGRVDINTFKDGISGVANNITKLGAALLTSPIFLVGAAIAGIIAAVVSWGDSMEETAAKNDKAVDRILKSLEKTTAEYDRQIKLQESLGKNTDKLEDQRLKNISSRSRQALQIKKDELKTFEGLEKRASEFGLQGQTENFERVKKLREDIFDLEQQDLEARNELQVNFNNRQKEKDEKKQDDEEKAASAAKALSEKRAQEILAAQKALQQSQINLLEDGQRKQRQQIKFDFDERIKAIKGNSDAEIALRKSLELEKQKALDAVAGEQRESKIQFIRKEGVDRARELKQLNDNDLAILNSGAKTLDEFNRIQADKRVQEIAKNVETFAAFGNSIVTIGQSVSTLLAENSEEAAEKNKLFAAFGIGLNLATSLAQMIAGATAAAAATGPLAPFTLVAYIAQGTALVLGAFAQIKTLLSAPTPKAAAKGDEYVTGGVRGKDSVPYSLMPGERVVTTAVNEKYWDDLHAMHTGNYEKHLNEKRILPALRKAMMLKADADGESFANNIANSLLLSQSWKGGNIVAQLQRINDQENGRHKELVQAIKTKSRGAYRKK